jgi:recombinational DNA repair protein (RecF pathway)
MNEYVSEAIVLAKEPQGELDERVSVFTKNLGKFTAKVKSGRRIKSKLSPHLEPGNVIRIRMVEKGNLQVVDALKSARLSAPPHFFYLLSRVLHEGEPEQELWRLLSEGNYDWNIILAVLGWDPGRAACQRCNEIKPASFHIASQDFFCGSCDPNVRGERIYV